MLKRFAVLAGVLLLGACSAIGDWMEGKVEYKTANTLPPLEIPPDLTSPARDNRYVVPDAAKSTATLSGYEAERREAKPSAGAVVLPQVERMHVERAGTQRWLVVDEKPRYQEVRPLSTEGRVFTIFLILGGVATFLYAASEAVRGSRRAVTGISSPTSRFATATGSPARAGSSRRCIRPATPRTICASPCPTAVSCSAATT